MSTWFTLAVRNGKTIPEVDFRDQIFDTGPVLCYKGWTELAGAMRAHEN